MTLQYIKQLDLYLKRATNLRVNPTVDTVCNLDKELRTFCGNEYIPFKLSCTHARFYGNTRSL